MIDPIYYDILDHYEELGFAIIIRAAADWMDAKVKLEDNSVKDYRYKNHYEMLKRQCERFFRSENFSDFCLGKYDGEELLERLNILYNSGTRKIRLINEYVCSTEGSEPSCY